MTRPLSEAQRHVYHRPINPSKADTPTRWSDTKATEQVSYDSEQVEREKRRKRVTGMSFELRTRIDESLSRRMPAMRRVKS